jgi:hypothetical protein
VDRTGVAAAALLLLAFGGGMQLWTNPAWLPITGLAVALLVIAALGGADLRRALVLFGWYWPPCYLLASAVGHWDNRNIAAVWSVAAVLALTTTGQKRDYVAIAANVALLLWLGSRGAALGLWAGLLVLWWPVKPARWSLLASLLVLPLLVWLRPDTAGYRFDYWRGALAAWQTSPWWGVGYGGLQAGCWLPEPVNDCQLHAHNLFVHVLAEFGLVGLVWLLVGLYLLAISTRPRWEWALIAALLAHSLVDLPLFWLGPAALFVVVAIKPRQFLPVWKFLPGFIYKKMVVSNYSREE